VWIPKLTQTFTFLFFSPITGDERERMEFSSTVYALITESPAFVVDDGGDEKHPQRKKNADRVLVCVRGEGDAGGDGLGVAAVLLVREGWNTFEGVWWG
jgi:NAD(P)H-hydrate repair Nnr-like enzyme with NAD(P)H-hydrate epimerase domain